MTRAVVMGLGSYLPARVMKNAELEATLDTTDAWIRERTGIEARHIAGAEERTSDLAAAAARAALADAKLSPEQIDGVILATTTPDVTMPATATRVQALLGISRGPALDVNAACSGFVYAMATADGLLQTGVAKRVLVIGAETFSRIVDWNDRGTCILFGDGAGAVVLEAQATTTRGVLHSALHADGRQAGILGTSGGVSSTQTAGVVHMQGKEVFRHAVTKMTDTLRESMAALKLPMSSLDLVVPHQANQRILASVAEHLGLPPEKLVSTVAQHANTSAASIPLALCAAKAAGNLKKDALVGLVALGAGLTWGSCIIRW